MDTLNKVNVTERATSGGWILPEGWTVWADISPDDNVTDLEKEFDCYTPAQVAAWKRDEWRFVVVSVYVQDPGGREWGGDVLGGVEFGAYTMTDEDDDVTGHMKVELDPLADKPGEYSAIREHDMIGNALRDAVAQLAEFGNPVITEPEGTTVTGL